MKNLGARAVDDRETQLVNGSRGVVTRFESGFVQSRDGGTMEQYFPVVTFACGTGNIVSFGNYYLVILLF